MDSIKLFEVFDMFGHEMMSTDYESCIEYDYIEGMAQAGFKFKVAGKFVPKTKIKEAVETALSHGVGYRFGQFGSEAERKAMLKATEPDRPIDIISSTASTPEEIEEYERTKVDLADPEPIKAEIVYSKQVRCIETGKIYKNQSEAARDLGIDPAQVSDSIKTGRKRSGYTFERLPLNEVG